MRYFAKKPNIIVKIFGDVFVCNHPIYNSGTLFKESNRGLVIIQQYFDDITKKTWWGPIEPWLANNIYLHKDFELLFKEYSNSNKNGIYPTITVRHAMHWLKMKPLQKRYWETVFDRKLL